MSSTSDEFESAGGKHSNLLTGNIDEFLAARTMSEVVRWQADCSVCLRWYDEHRVQWVNPSLVIHGSDFSYRYECSL